MDGIRRRTVRFLGEHGAGVLLVAFPLQILSHPIQSVGRC